MPLKPSQVLAKLQNKRDDFQIFDQKTLKEFQQYQKALQDATQQPNAWFLEQLAGDCGAIPLEPLNHTPDWIVRSNLVWQSREQSLTWVKEKLTGIATFAVDGSQIYPSKDLSIPVALVQIGWFENPHLPTGSYEKDIELDVMTPADLRAGNSGEPVDRRVSMRRFEMETQRLITYMEERAHSETCLVFFDGSLIVTFAEAFDEETRNFYTRCVLKLLQASETFRVPLVAYIDTSYARDLTVMLQTLFELPESRSVHDAQLLGRNMQWGDRTPLFLSQRAGILDRYGEQADKIAFTYLKTHDGYPVRLELPLWLYDAGLSDRVIDWVRGEVIVGNGYPYVIETADQVAVLKNDDRQVFYRLLQDWADKEELNLRLSRKMVSKARRR
ncbi:MAG: DNA double-strand break repair nuclease NurA [Scytolyngbya sp. HA4215-MV1]|jgi:hypothetical protein|nr:DNA double-strand break repair nuclease NurA [Scytolyngbya sp. HA4215-MV1]